MSQGAAPARSRDLGRVACNQVRPSWLISSSPPPSQNVFPPSKSYGPAQQLTISGCLTILSDPRTLIVHGSHRGSYGLRDSLSLGPSLLRRSTVLILNHSFAHYLLHSIHHFRDSHHSLLPMYVRFIGPGREALQVDTRGPHSRHVLVGDNLQHDQLQ